MRSLHPDPKVAAMLAAIGDRFDIKGLVGEGGSAFVFRACERPGGRDVAIKVLHPNLMHDPAARAAFIREAELLEGLQHRNIVRITEVVQRNNQGCAIVMPYIDGYTLKEEIKASGPLPLAIVRAILRDILAALQYAHGRGVVHRDIKPHNIFLDSVTSSCLLGDFGIAARLDEFTSPHGPDTVGTPQYMAPEQIDGRPVDQRSDVYSVGCVAFEMITGSEPWARLSLSEVLQCQRRDPLPSVRSTRADVPADLVEFTERCLEKDPERRWKNASEMIRAINSDGSGIATPVFRRRSSNKGSPVGFSVFQENRISKPMVLLGMGGALILFGLSSVSRTGSFPAPPAERYQGPTNIDPILTEQPPEAAKAPSEPDNLVLEQAQRSLMRGVAGREPKPVLAPTSPKTEKGGRDGQAQELLGQALRISGTGEGFELILDLRWLSESAEVSPELRRRLSIAANQLRNQCESLKMLNPAVVCP